ncbi:DNA binding protein [Arthrobacter phage Jawnski]|uniref:Helix-turn-helix DNA binding domain protein n=3 Tax=Jawnskivirus TaxID=3425003 RepID=A0A222Z0Y4_9CAUD|nr:DNA binding protein [Arthrobacter phage Brent]YP_009601618.1 DNA binding protein [Arthrobacter phage Jawnski]ALF01270.1 helix-turn-helix DNA binding domain protein [Arthrobacter phage Brent]ALY09387.1 helix-turn-helix DNA binding domain protein [Arthrobacter phage Jawnski]ASR78159.1 helix-turn-helix DNA binding domain protein [Arthrobacter phage Franzy]
MIIECTKCPHTVDVSDEDPDASYQDALEHVGRRHPEVAEAHHAVQLRGSDPAAEVPC